MHLAPVGGVLPHSCSAFHLAPVELHPTNTYDFWLSHHVTEPTILETFPNNIHENASKMESAHSQDKLLNKLNVGVAKHYTYFA